MAPAGIETSQVGGILTKQDRNGLGFRETSGGFGVFECFFLREGRRAGSRGFRVYRV